MSDFTETCICGGDSNSGLLRLDIVCPKCDGEVRDKSERTVDDALANARKWRDEEPSYLWLNEPNATMLPRDLVLLADEVQRLQALLKG